MIRLSLILLLTCACIYSQAQVNLITTLAGNGIAGYCCDDGPAINAEFNHPDQLCLDNFGNIYIADPGNNRVRKIVLSTGIITTIAGNGSYGFSGDGEQATSSQLWVPDGVCTDTFGNIYIADGENHRIRKVTVATGIITTIAGNGTAGNSGDGNQATNAQINGPQCLSMDNSGNLYLADIFNNNIRKINSAGIITTIAGIGTAGYSGDGGQATNAELNQPGEALADNYGNIIISDCSNHAIRKVNVSTGIINTLAGNDTLGYSGDGGLSTSAKMSFPYGLFIDKHNNIFIVETGNGIVRRIDGLTGIISTVVGCGTIGFSGDGGPATNAELIPDGVTIDDFGTMFIADFSNDRIRKVYNDKLGISNVLNQGEQKYSIHPNPNDGNFVIQQYLPHNELVKVKIYDAIGRSVYISELEFTNTKSQINLNNYVPGIYLIEITDSKNRIFRFKFVINK